MNLSYCALFTLAVLGFTDAKFHIRRLAPFAVKPTYVASSKNTNAPRYRFLDISEKIAVEDKGHQNRSRIHTNEAEELEVLDNLKNRVQKLRHIIEYLSDLDKVSNDNKTANIDTGTKNLVYSVDLVLGTENHNKANTGQSDGPSSILRQESEKIPDNKVNEEATSHETHDETPLHHVNEQTINEKNEGDSVDEGCDEETEEPSEKREIVEHPAEEHPVDDHAPGVHPVEEHSKNKLAPADEANHEAAAGEATHEAPLDEANHEAPAGEATHEAPPEEANHEAPAHEAPAHEAPAHEAPAHEAPAHEAPAHEANEEPLPRAAHANAPQSYEHKTTVSQWVYLLVIFPALFAALLLSLVFFA